MRNAIINNLNPLVLRQDVGALWENFLVSERLKRNSNAGVAVNRYFWRTTTGKEIDYLEDAGGVLCGYEFKWRKENFSVPKEFLTGYPGSQVLLINRENYHKFLV
jgi:predicted AAA+ superfamily ATPase